MKKKIFVSIFLGSMCLIFLTLGPVLASVASYDSSEKQTSRINNFKPEKEVIASNEVRKSDADINLRRPDERIGNEIISVAKDLGITTEDKSIEQIQNEIKIVLVKQQAEKEGITTEGKDDATLITEVRSAYEEKVNKEEEENKVDPNELRVWHKSKEEEFRENAKDKGIEVEGKSNFDIYKELNKDEILKKAKELGIDVTGKSIDEILNEAKEIPESKNNN
ncbi:hypothetical protein LC085_06930 [Bacillus tianshenii]|uniref:hypothetical protein n=1 Tax=Sutcliffiella tianshenii TaxID=1463404 RepID=UPI001CD479E6|nr:hypothetical protein [Bacillus tianshenii]MCA1319644.1 hypothetical protein [Bacillus tianshenii]